ncbi:MAG: aldose 1-epimerase family protein [Bacteroidetes bacterium]|nr:aldose 1-epimerase family protein [Bacteroidota bacterium]
MQSKLTSKHLTVTINHFGAEVCSVKSNNNVEFVWQGDKVVWARHAPVLFPIVGKLKDNFFIYEGKKYELPQHGFARDMDFDLLEKNETSLTFQLVSNNETKNKFPFDFVFQIKYILEDKILHSHYTITNPLNKTLFASVGAHPGFNCPILPGEKFEDYYLEFESDVFSLTQLNNGLRSDAKAPLRLNDKKLFLTKELFDNDALVFENSQINKVSLYSSRSNHKITMQCINWPYFGIWAKKGNTQFICLEPWYGIASHENGSPELPKKDGIIHIAAGKDFKAKFSLIFS